MRYIILTMLIALSISCKKQKNEELFNIHETIKGKNIEMTNVNETLVSGLNLVKVSFSGEKLEIKKYKYNRTYMENIKIADLLNKEYRFFF